MLISVNKLYVNQSQTVRLCICRRTLKYQDCFSVFGMLQRFIM